MPRETCIPVHGDGISGTQIYKPSHLPSDLALSKLVRLLAPDAGKSEAETGEAATVPSGKGSNDSRRDELHDDLLGVVDVKMMILEIISARLRNEKGCQKEGVSAT